MITGDNYYDARVYTHDQDDADRPPIVRALHVELCRDKPHGGSRWPACERAWSVFERWTSDGSPTAPAALTAPTTVRT